ncbi:MAG: hypothetical protein K0S39_5822, partial [Paenibacillus sp.]|nr:hypothetical protein [Paenibacillus sp.]
MDRFYKNQLFTILVYVLLCLLVLFMLLQIRPMLLWIYGFLTAILGPFIIAMI